jgi:protein ImuB
MTAFACIFVPDFPVEALLRAEPELRSQPVAVLEGKPPLQKVFAVNDKARHAGISAGMTKMQVEALSDLVLRVRSPLQETSAHAALLDCAQSFSPRVEDTASDTIILDVEGLEPLFGPLPKVARDIARRASDLGLETNVAVAYDPDTAVLAARGFSGITIIAPGHAAEHLGSLPLDVLFRELSDFHDGEEPARLFETLERWGIRNLRALATLPPISISERLGQAGVRLHQLSRGALSRTMVPVDLPLNFEEAIELEYPLVLLEPLAFLLGRLLDQLCTRLAARALATQHLRLQLELDNGYHDESTERPQASRLFHRTLRLPVPLLDAKLFLKLLQLDLKAYPPGAPIVKIRLAAEPVRPRAGQAGLFLPPTPEPEKLELTLARIAGIVGEGKVGSLQLLDTYRPEGFRMQHFAPGEASTRPAKPPTDTGFKPSGRAVTALRIFRPPVSAAVTIRDGKPVRVICLKRKEMQGEILWAAGPWHSSGGWWEQEGWSRDEWDIAVQSENAIALYRLVRDLMSGQWLVEGTYD